MQEALAFSEYVSQDGVDMHFSLEQMRMYDLTPEDVHIDAALSNILQKYRPMGAIAEDVLPIVPVAKQSDVIPKIDKAAFFREPAGLERAPGTEPKMIHFLVSSDTYFCINYALGTYITREELANADPAWNPNQLRGELILDAMAIDRERRMAGVVFNTSNVGSNFTPASLWNDWTNSNPYADMVNALEISEQLSGIRPNRVVFGRTSWFNFKNSDKVKTALVPYGGADAGMPMLVNPRQVAQLLEVETVLIGGMYYNTAVEDASAVLSRIWGSDVTAFYTPGKPSKEKPSWGYNFRWTVPGLPNLSVRRFPFDDKKGRQDLHIHVFEQEKILDTSLAIMVQSVIA